MKINSSVVCELVGDDVVVLDSENSAVVTLTGDSAKAVKRVLAGEKVSHTEPGVDELLSQGIILSTSPNGLSRRSLVTTGVAVGAGGIFALSLPAAANSSSPAQVTEPEVIEPEKLDAPQFIALTQTWDRDDWYRAAYIDSGEAYLDTKFIENFDENLTYEFRFADAADETFFPMVLVGDELFYDDVAGLPGAGSTPIAALLRVTNDDGQFSDGTPFFFGDD